MISTLVFVTSLVYLVTHIVTFSESPKATSRVAILGKVTNIPCEPRLTADKLGGSEHYNMSDEVH